LVLMSGVDRQVSKFVSEITRGPFRCLGDGQSDGTSEYVVKQNQDYEDIYECAVYQAYLDMCRTLAGIGKSEKKAKTSEITRSLATASLRDYFSGRPKTKEEAFDGWHGATMLKISTPLRLKCGQAQKILNMAFKYLYCCKDIREGKAKHFKYCHMPLDSYTLAWYKRECDTQYDGEAWSSIDDIVKYARITESIRQKLNRENVLLAEFGIWQEEKERINTNMARKAALKVASYDGCPSDLREQLARFSDDLDEQLSQR